MLNDIRDVLVNFCFTNFAVLVIVIRRAYSNIITNCALYAYFSETDTIHSDFVRKRNGTI